MLWSSGIWLQRSLGGLASTLAGVRPASDAAEEKCRRNHNTIHYPVVLGAVAPGSQRALDVGCGEGTLTRQLRRLVPEVVGIDTDEASIAAARADPVPGNIRYVVGDVLTDPLEPSSFDLVSAVASLHHISHGIWRKMPSS